MRREHVAFALFVNTEWLRSAAIRWLSGHPGDALMALTKDGESMLVPWDKHLASLMAKTELVIPYTQFERDYFKAVNSMLEYFKVPSGSRVEIPPSTPYPIFLRYVELLDKYDVICHEEGGIHSEITEMRAVKDEAEIALYRKVSAITDKLINLLEQRVRRGAIKTEADAALFIEARCREYGCEGTGFETIAAGPSRSFGIHAFPAYTAGPFAAPGLSILDFGLKYKGYTSDVTMTFACPPLSNAQELFISLTEKAYETAVAMLQPHIPTRDVAAAAALCMEQARKPMPHGLGHGIGLDAHEAPAVQNRRESPWTFAPGMVFTIEPGVYDPVHGGCRLENDFLMGEDGAEQLTNSRIVRL
jgi:Xaa-Pro dipeptidase